MSCWLKALPVTLAVAAVTIFTASCGSTGTTHVRFVNAIQDTAQYGTGLDIQISGTKEFTDVAFFGYSPTSGYTNVPSGGVLLEALETGSATAVFSADLTLTSGSQRTLVATGFAINSAKVAVINAADNNTAPTGNNVEFRVIDASPSGPPAVDVYILPVGSSGSLTPPATIANLAYRSASSYVTIPYNSNRANGANYTMFVTATGTTTPILLTQSVSAGTSFEGAIRTLILTDQENIDQLNPLAIVLNDLN